MNNLETYGQRFIAACELYGPKLLGAIVVFVIGLWVINWLTKLSRKAMMQRELDISLQSFLLSLANVTLKVMLLITVAGMIGIQTTSFVAILGAAGLAVGLALQGSLANFAGGVLTLVFKPYKVGDVIETQGQVGQVMEIQIFNTILLTPNNKTVILPNGAVSNGTIVNQSRHGNLRVEIQITVDAGHDIDKVRAMILAVVNAHPKVLKEPAATVDIAKLGGGGVVLAVHPYTLPGDVDGVSSNLQEQLNAMLVKNSINPPVPAAIAINRNGDK